MLCASVFVPAGALERMNVPKPSTTPQTKALTAAEAALAKHPRTLPLELGPRNHEFVQTKAELERLRARYLELFDFAPVPYFTFNERGVIRSLNLAAAELLQVDRHSAVGMSANSFLAPESRGVFKAHVARVFREPRKHLTYLVLTSPKLNPQRHLHVVSRLIRDDTGEGSLCLSAAVDITARRVAEEEVSRLNAILEQRVAQRTRELEESNKDLEAFIYSISHDLRAPLRNMAGFASIIADDYSARVPPEVNGFVQRIIAGNHKMLHLVDDLLRFSRLGRKPLDVALTDLNELLDEALSDLSAEMHGREIEWRRKPLPMAECDRGLMRQVFVNFLSNALKYTRPRRPAVIKTSCEVRGSERVIVIQDNGVGFDMRYSDKLFGVFQRLHMPSEFEGNGVGLAMIARILARHNGCASAEGRVDHGATFWFTFDGLRTAV
jgi:PAS domain S-box-containing protein